MPRGAERLPPPKDATAFYDFEAVLDSVMGLYEVTSVGYLLGLRMVIMVSCFHVSVILQCQ